LNYTRPAANSLPNLLQKNLVEGEGFEPSKAEPSDLQSEPFDRSGTPPAKRGIMPDFPASCQCRQRLSPDIPYNLPKPPSHADMKLASLTLDNARVVAVQGRIDQASAEDFRIALEPHLATCTADAIPLVIDFSDVPYISSVGLRVLMLAARQAEMQKGRLAIARLSPTVREVFAISRFDLVLKTCDTIEDAIASLR
jgi:anti-anti-sigma factor